MPRLTVTLGLLLACLNAIGQDRAVIDSLHRVLQSTQIDTVRVYTLIELAGHHYLSEPDKAIAFCEQAKVISERTATKYKMADVLGWLAYLYEQQGQVKKAIEFNQQALHFAERAGNKMDESTILTNLAAIYSNQGKLDEALLYNERSLALKLETGHRKELATTYNNIGLIYLNQGRIVEALDYYMRSLSIEEEFNNPEGVATSLENIAHVYKAQKEFAPAFVNARKGLSIRQKLKDRYGEGYALNTIGVLHEAQGRSDSALHYFERSYAIREKLKDRQGMAYSMKNIGGIHEKLGRHGQAIGYFSRSLSIFEELDEKWGVASVTCRLGGLLMATGDLDAAETQLTRSLRLAKELGYPADIRNAADQLQQLYRKRNNWRKALEMSDLYVQMRDSVENDENRREAVRTQFRYEYEKKEAVLRAEQEQKDALAREELRRKDLQRNASIAGLGLMLLLTVVFLVQRNRIGKERDRSEKLLLNILPGPVAEELKAKGHANAKLFVQATVLFTDFKGFTDISEQLAPKELVALIDRYFRGFDAIVRRHGLEKIKTIGDSYMAVSGVPERSRTHAVKAVRAAIEMRDLTARMMEELAQEGRRGFEIRIGLHTGPVVAGVVGEHKFQYDIWGDTVNTASRMESSGEVGKVNISEATYQLVKDEFTCEYRGEIEAKGKGRLGMYFVVG